MNEKPNGIKSKSLNSCHEQLWWIINAFSDVSVSGVVLWPITILGVKGLLWDSL